MHGTGWKRFKTKSYFDCVGVPVAKKPLTKELEGKSHSWVSWVPQDIFIFAFFYDPSQW